MTDWKQLKAPINLRFSFGAAFVGVALLAAQPAYGQRGRAVSDDQIVREAELVASGARVELFQHGLLIEPALLKTAEESLARMEALLGQKLDESTLGPKIRIYVSTGTTVSHVWRGYEHPKEPRAVILLNPRVARAAIRGIDATYAHEMAHLLTWRFRSHTLREGLADYVALKLHPGAGVGPNPQGYSKPPTVTEDVEKFLGTTKSPPPALVNDLEFRRAYYFASYRFVKLLIEREGIPVFLKLYSSKNLEADYRRLYRARRAELVLAARSR